MEHEQTSREQIVIIVLLCLLLHVLFVALFFFWQHADHVREMSLAQQYEQRMEELLKKQTQTPLTPEEEKELFEWVNGQAKGNAAVIFESEPMEEQGQPEGVEEGAIVHTPSQEELLQEKPLDTMPLQETSFDKEEKQVVIQEQKATQELIERTEKTTLATAEPEEKVQPQEKAPEKKATTQPEARSAKKINLAQITKGLVQKMHNESKHLVNAVNGKDGKITEEQLRYERYFKKVEWHFNNSDRIHRSTHLEALMKAREKINGSAQIFIALNRNGSLAELKLVSSCGAKVIDEYFMFIVKDAASSFPTVPSFLPAPFKFHYIIGMQVSQQSTSPIRFTMS